MRLINSVLIWIFILLFFTCLSSIRHWMTINKKLTVGTSEYNQIFTSVIDFEIKINLKLKDVQMGSGVCRIKRSESSCWIAFTESMCFGCSNRLYLLTILNGHHTEKLHPFISQCVCCDHANNSALSSTQLQISTRWVICKTKGGSRMRNKIKTRMNILQYFILNL